MNGWFELRAVILAAGKETLRPARRPLVLEALGERVILDYVVENALQVVAPDDLYIVIGAGQGDVPAHLGDRFHYVTQAERRGTGDAVLQLRPHLQGYTGDLLILYGDTPLFRPGSIRQHRRHPLRP